jgi:acetyltransferase-like isoleucine patch superfamily enzyme
MNQIDVTAKIHPNVKLGEFNRIGKNVVIEILGDDPNLSVTIGDNNIINDNMRIFIHGKFNMGDWNVLHNDMLLMAEQHLYIGHNCWFGQNTILDGAGGLVIGNGVRVGMYSQVWTHVASGEQIEGCTLYSKRETIIEDDVWLVGSCIVGSGLKLGWRSVALINSVLTKDTLPDRAYAGSPAKLMEKAKFYVEKSLDEKFDLLSSWLNNFVLMNSNLTLKNLNSKFLILENMETKEKVIFSKNNYNEIKKPESVFYLEDKTFIKTNSLLERQVYKYLYNNKARFLPR